VSNIYVSVEEVLSADFRSLLLLLLPPPLQLIFSWLLERTLMSHVEPSMSLIYVSYFLHHHHHHHHHHHQCIGVKKMDALIYLATNGEYVSFFPSLGQMMS